MAEAQYQHDPEGLPGSYKLGAYYHHGRFADQRRNANGQSLADPLLTDPAARQCRHDYAVYAIADQLVSKTGDDGGINFYADAGVTWKGALPGRSADTAGLAFGIARISDTASKLDSEVAAFTNSGTPVRRQGS